jgi:uncharacterized protein YlbG (UPF0298 family)
VIKETKSRLVWKRQRRVAIIVIFLVHTRAVHFLLQHGDINNYRDAAKVHVSQKELSVLVNELADKKTTAKIKSTFICEN